MAPTMPKIVVPTKAARLFGAARYDHFCQQAGQKADDNPS